MVGKLPLSLLGLLGFQDQQFPECLEELSKLESLDSYLQFIWWIPNTWIPLSSMDIPFSEQLIFDTYLDLFPERPLSCVVCLGSGCPGTSVLSGVHDVRDDQLGFIWTHLDTGLFGFGIPLPNTSQRMLALSLPFSTDPVYSYNLGLPANAGRVVMVPSDLSAILTFTTKPALYQIR